MRKMFDAIFLVPRAVRRMPAALLTSCRSPRASISRRDSNRRGGGSERAGEWEKVAGDDDAVPVCQITYGRTYFCEEALFFLVPLGTAQFFTAVGGRLHVRHLESPPIPVGVSDMSHIPHITAQKTVVSFGVLEMSRTDLRQRCKC
jgi:hypothetical protein